MAAEEGGWGNPEAMSGKREGTKEKNKCLHPLGGWGSTKPWVCCLVVVEDVILLPWSHALLNQKLNYVNVNSVDGTPFSGLTEEFKRIVFNKAEGHLSPGFLQGRVFLVFAHLSMKSRQKTTPLFFNLSRLLVLPVVVGRSTSHVLTRYFTLWDPRGSGCVDSHKRCLQTCALRLWHWSEFVNQNVRNRITSLPVILPWPQK